MPFTPLRVRSHGSLLAGVAAPEALADRALELGYRALALTDRDNLYLAVRFLQHAAANGLRALPGAELTHGRAAVLLLPLDRRGWANLCALLTARHLDPAFDLAVAVGELHAGLHVVAESPALAAALLAAGVPAAAGATAPAREGRTPARPVDGRRGGLWLGVRGLPFERPRLRERLLAARELGVPAVATGDVLLLSPADHEAHRVAVTVAANELLERMPPGSFGAREAWLASPAEWVRRVRAVCAGAGCADAAGVLLANNEALAERCRCAIEMGVPIFPRAPRRPGDDASANAPPAAGAHADDDDRRWAIRRLRELAREGLERRYPERTSVAGASARAASPAVRRAARARCETELALIERMGFTDYFLLVADIVGFARSRGIPTVGRGSGAASIVAYLLGVTNVDPIRYGLRFERFLHPQRRDCPDLDVDLCWRRRDEVIAHVYEAYGASRVAMIATHATLGPRAAFREAAKVLGVPLPRVNALARRVPRGALPDSSALERTLHAGHADEFREPRIAEALRLAAKLAGAPRHLGVHCGGLVIADRELTHYLPLERAAKGVVISQFEMRAVEAIGLVKMDLLGNRAITTIGECLELTTGGAHGGAAAFADVRQVVPDFVPDPDDIPDDDTRTGEVVAAGDTLNCFQLESPAMRGLLRMLAGDTLDDTVAAVALVRPGPAESGAKAAFCRRRRGLEPVAFPHERLRETLAGTHGVLLYEEDVMRVAHALVGLPFAEGETLRRAIAAARDEEEFRFLERGFLARCARAGVAEADGRRVWAELARFAGYAFCKAHAAGYGRLAWQSAWLKTRLPAAWLVGVLHSHAGMYPTWVHVEDLRRGGLHRPPVRVLAPCVLRSAWESRLEDDGGAWPRATGPTAARGASAGADLAAEEGAARRRVVAVGVVVAARAAPSAASGGAPPAALLARHGAVRVGLHRVTGLSHATGARIVAARGARAFASLADLVDRARATPPELAALVLAGACDALPGPGGRPRTRASMLLEARVGTALAAAAGRRGGARAGVRGTLVSPDGVPLAPAAGAPKPGGEALPELPELPRAERVRGEFASTGLWFSAHPLEVFAPPEALEDTVSCASLHHWVGRWVALCGVPCASRRVEAKTGGHVLFTTLADRGGAAECVVFPRDYRRLGAAMSGEVVRVEGRVDETLGALTVVVERAASFGAGGSRSEGAPSRNRPESALTRRAGEQGPPSRYRVAP
ncbi:MAG: DNA polymerase III subunit alpha [Candidatus Eisenbacteria bacterium]|nr:DNA polymerase III subunit alpha [Candidatus Eisenbacteria bacterium]